MLGNDENGDQNITQEVAEWIDLRVWSAGGVREAALAVPPLYRDLAVAHWGSARVKQAEEWDPANICREGLAWVAGARKRAVLEEVPEISRQKSSSAY